MRYLLLFILANTLCFAETQAERSLKRLLEGNERFRNEKSNYPDRSLEKRLSLSEEQKPYAIILGCSDSRASPEIIFDQGIGDLFIVRVAGNVVGPVEVESVEYSVYHLGSHLLVVMGHENCGAVKAVYEKNTHDIEDIAKLIEPALKPHRKDKDYSFESAVRDNVLYQLKKIKADKDIKKLMKQGKLLVKGAIYHFETGAVELLD